MAGITLKGLCREFPGGVVAVRDLDLEIRDGEFLVLLGPSGCGKTTTLRLIAGLEPPTAGRVFVGARDVTDLAPRDRDVAMVFQNYALYPHMTVRDNLAFGLRMRKTPKPEIQRRIERVADTLGITELMPRKPAALSGGQRQRVALGRAIVREPVAFLFDEPLSNLDAKLRVHTRAELVRLHRELGTTMVYVTHDQTEAMTMGQRIAILDHGEMQQLGPPLDVYDRPANRMVAGFIGSPPTNFFDGTFETVDGTPAFRGASFTVPFPHAKPQSRRVTLGIRPEHVSVEPADAVNAGPGGTAAGASAAGGHAPASGQVMVSEPLGSETILYCRTDADETVIARVAGRSELRPDDRVRLRTDAERAYLFEGGDGRRVGSSTGVK
ncbi:MAG TPA: ABC transporter ATP-binding protein [Longimicrobiales bacterium]|nr:ABC transporter ATP-binding protein [Longimicrobiales bacterium]